MGGQKRSFVESNHFDEYKTKGHLSLSLFFCSSQKYKPLKKQKFSKENENMSFPSVIDFGNRGEREQK